MNKPTCFIKLLLPIPTKSPQEVKEISKFFKKNTQLIRKKDARKLYVQALSLSTTISEILKIKETFPKLQIKKIRSLFP